MTAFLASVLVFGGLWFWVLGVIAFFVIMAFAECDRYFFSFLTLAIFVGLMEYAGSVNIIQTMMASPLRSAEWVVVYFVLGGVWSFVKWYSFVSNKARDVLVVFDKWKKENPTVDWLATMGSFKGTPLEDNLIKYLNANGVLRYTSYGLDNVLPSASDNKDRLVSWIIWWPTSVVWTVINDPIRRLANWMYERLQSTYTRITTFAFRKLGM